MVDIRVVSEWCALPWISQYSLALLDRSLQKPSEYTSHNVAWKPLKTEVIRSAVCWIVSGGNPRNFLLLFHHDILFTLRSGCGGNVVHMAAVARHVVAVDIDINKLLALRYHSDCSIVWRIELLNVTRVIC